MLTRIEEEDASGINLVEWDAVEVASQFMENWCLDDRTGIKVPAGLKAKVKAAKNFRSATQCRRQLSFARLDMDLHSKDIADPNEAKKETFDHFGVPQIPEDRFLNAFTHIFAGGYAAGYYGYKWAEVILQFYFISLDVRYDQKISMIDENFSIFVLGIFSPW